MDIRKQPDGVRLTNSAQMFCVAIASGGHLVMGSRVILWVVVEVPLDMALAPTKYLSNESLDQLFVTLL